MRIMVQIDIDSTSTKLLSVVRNAVTVALMGYGSSNVDVYIPRSELSRN